ncbi:uncharacterized protein FTOL_13918 [Fusarium torulosum]|uniref:Uncharacterized protein n=1 Tax=Fusarium torulosum TaxID=33205 RepID=A0AAE8MMW8_9HYPO|nr:uncharacterized protein FTOL_13918 [Fusarium torulosum]
MHGLDTITMSDSLYKTLDVGDE